jgi:hypothetical protein
MLETLIEDKRAAFEPEFSLTIILADMDMRRLRSFVAEEKEPIPSPA